MTARGIRVVQPSVINALNLVGEGYGVEYLPE